MKKREPSSLLGWKRRAKEMERNFSTQTKRIFSLVNELYGVKAERDALNKQNSFACQELVKVLQRNARQAEMLKGREQ